jgi:hypothetical protein
MHLTYIIQKFSTPLEHKQIGNTIFESL